MNSLLLYETFPEGLRKGWSHWNFTWKARKYTFGSKEEAIRFLEGHGLKYIEVDTESHVKISRDYLRVLIECQALVSGLSKTHDRITSSHRETQLILQAQSVMKKLKVLGPQHIGEEEVTPKNS